MREEESGSAPHPTRRRFLIGAAGAAGLAGAGVFGVPVLLPRWLGPGPFRPLASLSDAARELVEIAFEGVDRARILDVHVHLVGLETDLDGCSVSERMRSPWHPIERLRFSTYLRAAGVGDAEHPDAAYVERLLTLQRDANPEGRLLLLAFDEAFDPSGRPRPERTAFHTPDAYALALAREHPEFRAAASVHPYRADALERLDAAARAGAVAIKWLPNAMGIDPASARLDPYYERMAELGLVLLTHTGEERAVGDVHDQALGNPLRLRRALAAGVRTIAAHCASLGEDADLDRGGARGPSFDLFLRMLEEEREHGRLFGGISAVTQVNRPARVLAELLRRQDLHERLVNGSDYPLPAIDPLVSTRQLVHREFLDPAERDPLNEIYRANPLLFDFVLKRRLRLVEGGRTLRFAPSVFESARIFPS